MHLKREAFREAYWKHWVEMKGHPDVILSPVGPGVAPKLDKARYWGYTAIWNLLDYPAAVFPVSQVKEKEDSSRGPFLDPQDEWNWKQCTHFGQRVTDYQGRSMARRDTLKPLLACKLLEDDGRMRM